MRFNTGFQLTEDRKDEAIPLASIFQELRERGLLETQTDKIPYTNTNNLRTFPEGMITEIICQMFYERRTGLE